jgi:hypothetical protein
LYILVYSYHLEMPNDKIYISNVIKHNGVTLYQVVLNCVEDYYSFLHKFDIQKGNVVSSLNSNVAINGVSTVNYNQNFNDGHITTIVVTCGFMASTVKVRTALIDLTMVGVDICQTNS